MQINIKDIVLVLASLLVFIPVSNACSCQSVDNTYRGIQQAYEGYDLVFVGKVISLSNDVKAFVVEKDFKNVAKGDTLKVYNTDSCSAWPRDNKMLIYGERFKDGLSYSFCSLSKPLNNSKTKKALSLELEYLDKLSQGGFSNAIYLFLGLGCLIVLIFLFRYFQKL